MGVLDPSGPAEVKFGSSESTDIIDFFQTLIFWWTVLVPNNFIQKFRRNDPQGRRLRV